MFLRVERLLEVEDQMHFLEPCGRLELIVFPLIEAKPYQKQDDPIECRMSSEEFASRGRDNLFRVRDHPVRSRVGQIIRQIGNGKHKARESLMKGF